MRMIGAFAMVLCVAVVMVVPATGAIQDDAAQVYAGKCAMCHGKTGAGDGAAAAAMDPKPTDFTSAEYQEGRTDEQIANAITAGKGTMPAYGKQLSEETITGLVGYIRELGKQ
jgi:mono/diheme cytochrome c family protein